MVPGAEHGELTLCAVMGVREKRPDQGEETQPWPPLAGLWSELADTALLSSWSRGRGEAFIFKLLPV